MNQYNMPEIQQTLSNVQRQEQQLSARQLQSLELLNLPLMALEEHLSQVLATNPILEAEIEEPAPLPEPPAPSSTESEDEATFDERAVDSDEWADELPVPGEWSGENFSNERQDYILNSLTGAPSLQEQLQQELSFADLAPAERKIAEAIIDSIDDTGYFRSTISDIAMSYETTPEKVEQALALIQSFEPAGVGARDLAECLKLQLIRRDELTPELDEILTHHLDDIARNHLPQLAKTLHITLDELNEDLLLLRTLTPYPGSALAPETAEFIIPEVTIVRTDTGYEVIPRREGVPRLYLAERYVKMLENPDLSNEDRSYLKEKMQQGKELIRALDLRQNTIVRIAEVLVNTQREFLDNGVEALKPLTMKQAGDLLELHETTISRAVANKYVETPQGIFPFKFFFTAGFTNEDGETVSNRAVMEKIRDLIEHEPPARPLSDEQLTKLLKAEGLAVARRTVAKYREQMNIPSSTLRKQHL